MGFFGKKSFAPLEVDIHSHLIHNIDDGSQSIEQSIEMLRELVKLGFKKVITTPHIHPRYPNTPQIIMDGFEKLQAAVSSLDFEMEMEVAAEYYVDDAFMKKVKADDTILSFGDKYVLVESSFINKPAFFESVLFDLKTKGYQPVLAHPERYQFLEGRMEWLEELKSMGVMLQVTLGSIGGYYGSIPQKLGKQLLQREMVDFLGSDLHRYSHLEFLAKGLKSKEVQKSIKENQLKNHLLQ
ncbi:tyrosine-protein phosphatase [Ekhidna sp.]|uniref:tyrosine-protein phosphatase n=1 Tax=Ekhidna sp. TaxID=2608089 RepID=UPI003516E355